MHAGSGHSDAVDAAPDRDGARIGAEGLWNAWKRSSGIVALAVVLTLVAYGWFTMVVSGRTDRPTVTRRVLTPPPRKATRACSDETGGREQHERRAHGQRVLRHGERDERRSNDDRKRCHRRARSRRGIAEAGGLRLRWPPRTSQTIGGG